MSKGQVCPLARPVIPLSKAPQCPQGEIQIPWRDFQAPSVSSSPDALVPTVPLELNTGSCWTERPAAPQGCWPLNMLLHQLGTFPPHHTCEAQLPPGHSCPACPGPPGWGDYEDSYAPPEPPGSPVGGLCTSGAPGIPHGRTLHPRGPQDPPWEDSAPPEPPGSPVVGLCTPRATRMACGRTHRCRINACWLLDLSPGLHLLGAGTALIAAPSTPRTHRGSQKVAEQLEEVGAPEFSSSRSKPWFCHFPALRP